MVPIDLEAELLSRRVAHLERFARDFRTSTVTANDRNVVAFHYVFTARARTLAHESRDANDFAQCGNGILNVSLVTQTARSAVSPTAQSAPCRPAACDTADQRSALRPRNPNHFRIVGPPFIRVEVPILTLMQPRDVAIEEEKLRTLLVQIRVSESPRAVCVRVNGRNVLVIKHVYNSRR